MRNQDVSQLVEFGMSEFCRGRNFGECSVRQGLHLGRRTQIVSQIFHYLDQSDVALQEGVVDMLCKDKMEEQLNTEKDSYLRKNSKKLSSRNGSKPRTRDTE
jgi:hypothetical protein